MFQIVQKASRIREVGREFVAPSAGSHGVERTSLNSHYSTLDFWQSEFGIISCNHVVTVKDHFHPTPVGASRDGGDDGLLRVSARDRAKAMDVGRSSLLLSGFSSLLVLVPPGKDRA